MHEMKLLHKLFENTRQLVDKRLHRLMLEVSSTLAYCKTLTLTELGRHLSRRAKVKHNIKTLDRLFGNATLSRARHYYYRDCVKWLIGNTKQPIIIVDWSGLTPCGGFHTLRASVPKKGRAYAIYDHVVAKGQYAKQATHEAFLLQLNALLPPDCKPIIVTDAGFRIPWFLLVLSYGWDYCGRIRHTTYCQPTHSSLWMRVKSLYAQATGQAKYLGHYLLSSATKFPCHFYCYRSEKKYRVRKNLAGKKIQCSVSLKHSRAAQEPWLLATSLSPNEFTPQAMIALYKTRMQIEENFRDLKNYRHGFSFRLCRSRSVHRLTVAMTLAAIASLLLWMVGIIIKDSQREHSYQANTVRRTSVLSTGFIGWQALIRNDLQFLSFNDAWQSFLKQLSLIELYYVFV